MEVEDGVKAWQVLERPDTPTLVIEFMIVAPNCDQSQAAGLAERIRKAIADHPFATPDGMIAVTMSLGVTAGPSGTDKDADHLIRLVDEALYQAKREGLKALSGKIRLVDNRQELEDLELKEQERHERIPGLALHTPRSQQVR